MAVAMPAAPLAMTQGQRQQFDEQGFILLEDFFTPAELERLLAAIDEVAARVRAEKGLVPKRPVRAAQRAGPPRGVPRPDRPSPDPAAGGGRDRLEHPDSHHAPRLPAAVPARGWSPGELGTGGGADQQAGYKNLVWHPDLAGPYLFEAPSLDGRLPFMEIKVGYYLSDLTAEEFGRDLPGPGQPQTATPGAARPRVPRPGGPVQRAERPRQHGDALAHPGLALRDAEPLGHRVRKVFYVGYHYRWLRPTDYVQQDPELIARSSPIRRQLLGRAGSGQQPARQKPGLGAIIAATG